jgi:DNA-binding response OmpR family regulator
MAQATGKNKRILVVDDEEKFCKIVAEFLRGRHYEVSTASTGAKALQQLEQFSPDVVLLDLVMPGLSGLDLLKLVRSRLFPPRVIIVTATETEDVAHQVMREGAEAYMCKPVSLDALERLISGFWPPQP